MIEERIPYKFWL